MAKPRSKSVEEKTRIVISILRGEMTIAAMARREAHMELRLWRKKGALYPATQSSMRRGERRG